MSTLELFPETDLTGLPREIYEWHGTTLNEYGQPRAEARLLPSWSPSEGWRVGWLAHIDRALDEWHPHAPDKHKAHAAYPWYRLDELPASTHFGVAAGTALRALKIVLEQMLGYVDPDLQDEVREMQASMERQAQAWLIGVEHG